MTGTTTRTTARAPAARLRMDPNPSRTTTLDGGWWPRSTDAAAELPGLVEALAGLRGRITHVLLNGTDWGLPHPRRVRAGDLTLRLGWYTSQPHGLVTIISEFGRDRFDLLVVPPDTGEGSAGTALTAAADGTDRRSAPELLAGIAQGG